MQNPTPSRFQQWRVKLVVRPAATPASMEPAFVRRPLLEQPGPDGIRHGLVERIRNEIAAGTYDTEERWLAAEEMLLSRIEAGA